MAQQYRDMYHYYVNCHPCVLDQPFLSPSAPNIDEQHQGLEYQNSPNAVVQELATCRRELARKTEQILFLQDQTGIADTAYRMQLANVHENDAKISELNNTIAKKDAQISELNNTIAQISKLIEELQQATNKRRIMHL